MLIFSLYSKDLYERMLAAGFAKVMYGASDWLDLDPQDGVGTGRVKIQDALIFVRKDGYVRTVVYQKTLVGVMTQGFADNELTMDGAEFLRWLTAYRVRIEQHARVEHIIAALP